MQRSTSESQGRFEIVCRVCDGLGIVFECEEDAPSSTPIKCRHCGGPRGTLGDLRSLAASENKIPLKSELLDGDKAGLRGRAVDANIVCMRIGKGETTLP
jgi:hypothetical protein